MRSGHALSALPVLALGCLFHASAIACTQLEYAELKDTPKERLVARYCQYGRFAKISQDTAAKLAAIGAMRDSSSSSAEARQCYDEMGKIQRALQNVYNVEPPIPCEEK